MMLSVDYVYLHNSIYMYIESLLAFLGPVSAGIARFREKDPPDRASGPYLHDLG